MKNKFLYDRKSPIEALTGHLKEITLNGYRGTPCEARFAKFFVLNANVLRLMRIIMDEHQGDQWLVRHCKKLRLRQKVATHAKFFALKI